MKISVVMATYNGERYLEKQVESILGQSLAPTQIVISDDGSTDNTVSMIEKYVSRQSNMVLLHSERKGINENFAGALAHCTGDYIAFSDQDDIWHTDKLGMLAQSVSGSTLLTYGRSVLIDDNDKQLNCSSASFLGFESYRAGRIPYYFLFSNCVSGHNMLVSKKLIEDALPFPGECMYDHWIALVASVQTEIQHAPEAITYHRIHDANSVNNAVRNTLEKKAGKKKAKYAKFVGEMKGVSLRLDKGLTKNRILSECEYRFWQTLDQKIQGLDGKIFDVQLFAMLCRKRADLFHGKLFRECRNRSLGGRYFRMIDSFRKSSSRE